MNPFILKGYRGPEYFCNREEDVGKIINCIRNQQDITLYAIRRIGKTTLIQHVFQSLNKEFDCVFADIWGSTSLKEFIRELANAVIQSSVFTHRTISKKLTDFIKSIGASISIGMDGIPSLDINYQDRNQAFRNLEEIIRFLNQNRRPVVLAIDEFQEIKKYSDTSHLEAKLRTLAQINHNIRFIFSGSEQHLLAEIFSDLNKPFYQTTRMIELAKIPSKEYHAFIVKLFNSGKKQVDPSVIDYILQSCHHHTYYVQAICNFLYSQSKAPSSISDFDRIYLDYLLEKKVFYAELPQLFTTQQFSVIKAFAQCGEVKSAMSAEFMQLSEVRSASSMQRIMKTLLTKQVIIREDKVYRLYDVFLEHYLRYCVFPYRHP